MSVFKLINKLFALNDEANIHAPFNSYAYYLQIKLGVGYQELYIL